MKFLHHLRCNPKITQTKPRCPHTSPWKKNIIFICLPDDPPQLCCEEWKNNAPWSLYFHEKAVYLQCIISPINLHCSIQRCPIKKQPFYGHPPESSSSAFPVHPRSSKESGKRWGDLLYRLDQPVHSPEQLSRRYQVDRVQFCWIFWLILSWHIFQFWGGCSS